MTKKEDKPDDPKFDILRRSVSEQKIGTQPESQIGNFMLETSEKQLSDLKDSQNKKSRNSEGDHHSDLSFG